MLENEIKDSLNLSLGSLDLIFCHHLGVFYLLSVPPADQVRCN